MATTTQNWVHDTGTVKEKDRMLLEQVHKKDVMSVTVSNGLELTHEPRYTYHVTRTGIRRKRDCDKYKT